MSSFVRLGAILAANVTSWPRVGVALLICVVVLLAIATALVNLRRAPAPPRAETDPLLLPRAHTADHEPIDV